MHLCSIGTNPSLELNLWDFGAEPDQCFLGLTLAIRPSVPDMGILFSPFPLSIVNEYISHL